MIRKLACAAVALAMLGVAPAALAQPAGGSPARVGIGLGIEPLNIGNLANRLAPPGVSIQVPIQIGSSLRIEPFLGFAYFSQNAAAADDLNQDKEQSSVNVGVGAFYYFVQPTPVGFYVGPRLAIVFDRITVVGPGPTFAETDIKQTDFQLALALGGEYFVAPRFSVGAEVQLAVTWYGDVDISGAPSLSRDASGFSTNGIVFLRYFFQ